jgi:hypothetical protein
MKIAVVLDVTPPNIYKFTRVSEECTASIFGAEVDVHPVASPEILLNFYQTTWSHITF